MQNKVNYSLLLEGKLKELEASGQKPRLLLHVCCAPCSSYVLEYLHDRFDITLYFYNPNIAPEEEYDFRFEEVTRLCEECGYGDIKIIREHYEPDEFTEMAKGLEGEPEGGARCYKCYRLRLRKAASAAKEGGFDYFTTTLSISPHKNAEWLNRIGAECGEAAGVPYLLSDFKKKGGYQRSIVLSREHNLYRQDYCGCIYSKNNR
ncbi:MAG: epoxyqueuosine reductase QueH [Ruminococcaceae bacterium]|nr:epoxyqueuosine reductase QueH [Oscillospiraceae bacterium]